MNSVPAIDPTRILKWCEVAIVLTGGYSLLRNHCDAILSDMIHFRNYNAYLTFARYIRAHRRHFLNAEHQQFLETVKATAERRTLTMDQGTELWRAQGHFETQSFLIKLRVKGEYSEHEHVNRMPANADRMKPQPHLAKEGRVNPKGIPCIYLADDRDTAMVEMRPWIGSFLSCGRFLTTKPLKLIDCSADKDVVRNFNTNIEPDDEAMENYVWGTINDGFSQPVTPADDKAEYAPSQVLSEFFHDVGFDGVRYGSKIGKGNSIALFDLNAVEVKHEDVLLFEIDDIKITFKEVHER